MIDYSVFQILIYSSFINKLFSDIRIYFIEKQFFGLKIFPKNHYLWNENIESINDHFMLINRNILVLLLLLMLKISWVWGQTNHQHMMGITSDGVQKIGSDSLSGNDSAADQKRWDHLTIISDSKLGDLLEAYRNERNSKGTIKGYRVQIFTGKRADADRIRLRFEEQYPDYHVHIKFLASDFYIRVGDFRTKSEAIHLKYLISTDYPDPFIVEDLIDYPPLEINEM